MKVCPLCSRDAVYHSNSQERITCDCGLVFFATSEESIAHRNGEDSTFLDRWNRRPAFGFVGVDPESRLIVPLVFSSSIDADFAAVKYGLTAAEVSEIEIK